MYYIDQSMRGVIKAHPQQPGDVLLLPLSDGPITQISVQNERVYALSESGSIQVCYRRLDSSLFPNSKQQMGGSNGLRKSESELEDEYDTYVMGIPPSPGLGNQTGEDVFFSDEENACRLGGQDIEGLGHHTSRVSLISETLVLSYP